MMMNRGLKSYGTTLPVR